MKKRIYLVSFICFVIDLVSKLFVLNNDKVITVIPNFFNIVLVKNTGAAFSSFEGFTYVFVLMAVLVLVYLFKYVFSNTLSFLEELSYSLLIGGIVGNLFDRIVYHGVIDFLSFNIFGYGFPVFNMADVFICVGVLLMIINMIRGNGNENNSRRR